MRYWLKECPRCGGDLRGESDSYGRYICCLQCGYILNHWEEARLLSVGTIREESPVSNAA